LRIISDNKGVARVIEAFLASVLLISCLAIIPQPPSKNEQSNLAATAQNILLSLDSDGYLAKLVDERNWTALVNCIESEVPLSMWFNLTVYDNNMQNLNDGFICNAGTVSNNIASIDYICASCCSTFTIYILRMQLSQVGST
jgi:hypothetical protein